MKPWQIITIPPEDGNDKLPHVLGISDERVKELFPIISKAYYDCEKVSETFELILDQCTNINEAIFAVYSLGRITTPNKFNPMQSLTEKDLPEELVDFIKTQLDGEIGRIFKVEIDNDKTWKVTKKNDSKLLYKSLGISDERVTVLCREMAKQSIKLLGGKIDVPELLENLSKFADNSNESHFMIFEMNAIINPFFKNESSPLIDFFKLTKEDE